MAAKLQLLHFLVVWDYTLKDQFHPLFQMLTYELLLRVTALFLISSEGTQHLKPPREQMVYLAQDLSMMI